MSKPVNVNDNKKDTSLLHYKFIMAVKSFMVQFYDYYSKFVGPESIKLFFFSFNLFIFLLYHFE
jgi:hypothetical protein